MPQTARLSHRQNVAPEQGWPLIQSNNSSPTMPKPTFPTNDAVPLSTPESPGSLIYEGSNDPYYKMDLHHRGNAIILILDGDKTRRAMNDAEMLETVVKDKWKLIDFMTTFANCVANDPEMDLVDLATTINRENRHNSERFSHYMSTLIRNLKFPNRPERSYWSSEEIYLNKSQTLENSIDVILSTKREVTEWLNKLDRIQNDDVSTKEMKLDAEDLYEVITVAQKNGTVTQMISRLRRMVERKYEEYEECCAKQASIANP
ncbi:hypothetical protein B566_EDAN013616 [Ephemera danica]|nr:hypothetical protein B566_EDAN013616 [Ephemera danica]